MHRRNHGGTLVVLPSSASGESRPGNPGSCRCARIFRESRDSHGMQTGKIRMDLGLKGKVALVNAASKGIGRAIALELAAEGANVAIASRSDDSLKAAADTIKQATGNNVATYTADLLSDRDVRQLVDDVERDLGDIDILVNSSAGPPTKPFSELFRRRLAGSPGYQVPGTGPPVTRSLPADERTQWRAHRQYCRNPREVSACLRGDRRYRERGAPQSDEGPG